MASDPRRVNLSKLRRLLEDARSNVPFYEQLYANVGWDNLNVAEMLNRLPTVSKDELLSVPLEARTNPRFHAGDLTLESTTGSTGQPFSMHVEKAYVRRRNLRFLRALVSVGVRPWHTLMLLTDRHKQSVHRALNRYYVSVEQPTSAIVDAYRQIRPQVLYGFLTPLRLLAELVAEDSAVPRPHLVVSTAEMLDSPSRLALESVFQSPVCDFYGLTEMGLVAWQGPGVERYVMSDSSTLTELVPLAPGGDRYRMIMTNLDLHASPMIRYDSGDVASASFAGEFARIRAIEGRAIDAIIKTDGSKLSPYQVTDAFRDVAGLRRFRLTQRQIDDVLVELEVHAESKESVAGDIRSVVTQLLGEGVSVDLRFPNKLVPEGSRKFRPVESLLVDR